MRSDSIDLGAPIPHLIQFKHLLFALAPARKPIANIDSAIGAERFEACLAYADGVHWLMSIAVHGRWSAIEA
jgi:hypothetical protein